MNRKKKIVISTSIMVTIILLLTITITYSFLRITKVQEENNIITTLDCLSTSLTNVNNAINLTSTYPISDEKGMGSTPYTFTITNNCPNLIKLDINLEVLSQTTLSSSLVKVALNKKYDLLTKYNITTSTINGATSYNLSKDIDFLPNQSISYDLRLWIDEPTTVDQGLNKTFQSKIVILTSPSESLTLKSLKDLILDQDGGVTAITAKSIPNFTEINSTSGIYATEDEYGTSYYYRGLKNNLDNNLIWAGFQWKIIRINGDGSIRIIYNGTEEQFNDNNIVNSSGVNTKIGDTFWNSNREDAKYVGYMYGGANGEASTMRNGDTSLAATYNETNSNIKTFLDNWYELNILNKGYSNVVADNLFCNDRQLRNEIGGPATGLGFGKPTQESVFATYYRNITNKIPNIKCGLQNDRFTVTDKSMGNGSLTYPVGSITADEATMAGLCYGNANNDNYLFTGASFLTFSPSFVQTTGFAIIMAVTATGDLANYFVSNPYGVRPVLSLNSNVKVSGTGTSYDPFRL